MKTVSKHLSMDRWREKVIEESQIKAEGNKRKEPEKMSMYERVLNYGESTVRQAYKAEPKGD